MRIVRSVSAMQRLALRWRKTGARVGFVPTMGYLHDGHISLVKRARRLVGSKGIVVVSIYVNPTQFAAGEDLNRYPRDFTRDRALCRRAGVDVIFAPSDREMYPGRADGLYSTYVVEEKLSRPMEGESRPGHFRGVATVVAKLFNIVQPAVAVFGAKDFQQAAVVRRMAANLNFAVRVVTAPTVRESDGLAMSSRNKYLSAGQRAQATVLWRALQRAREAIANSRGAVPVSRLEREMRKLIGEQPEARVDYIRFFDPETFELVKSIGPGVHLALAVFVGRTRLIDNARL